MDHLTVDELARIQQRLLAFPVAARDRCGRAMEAGDYGTCALCGADIPLAVLLERPDLATCADCAASRASERAGRRFGVCGLKGG